MKSPASRDLPVCIQRLVAAMRHTPLLNAVTLPFLIQDAGIAFDALRTFADFDHDPALSYGRRCLWQTKHMGVYLMSWNPGDFTALHGHGHAEWGAVVFEGETTHRSYRVQGRSVALRDDSTIAAGTVLGVCKADYYHAMGNLGKTPFQTLHIYGAYGYAGSSTDDARVFELEKDCISLTGGSAYVNMAESYRKSATRGIDADPETHADYLGCIRPFYERVGMAFPG
ncbi:MAG: cysteine dioxygenase [Kiritimatiellia bacterium]